MEIALALVIATAVAAVYVIGRVRRGGKLRNQRLAEWAKSIPLSERESDAMWQLWLAGKQKVPPKPDPLAELTPAELERVLHVCSANYRPKEFGSANTLRLAAFERYSSLGFTEAQAAILVGMAFNMVGRRDL